MANKEHQATFRAARDAEGLKELRVYVPIDRLELIKQVVKIATTMPREELAAWVEEGVPDE